MATAFAVFANTGFKVEPYFISRVEDSEGNILEQANPAVICRECEQKENDSQSKDGAVTDLVQAHGLHIAPRVIGEDNAFIITSIMQDVIKHGTGRRALELGRADLAGKTGTTNEFRDAWFSGFTPDLVATAWIGFDQPSSLGPGEAGARAALPIWIDFMAAALKGVPEHQLPVPKDVVAMSVDRNTGDPTDPEDPLAIVEYFIPGTEPGAPVPPAPGEDAPPTTATAAPPKVEPLPKDLF
jgi:penicillin-binding protein 1A